MDCVTTRLQMGIGMFFSVLDPGKCKEIGEIGEILFVVREPRRNFGENDLKRSSEIQKFSRENVDIFWWSANRDKICQVVRESEKFENR